MVSLSATGGFWFEPLESPVHEALDVVAGLAHATHCEVLLGADQFFYNVFSPRVPSYRKNVNSGSPLIYGTDLGF